MEARKLLISVVLAGAYETALAGPACVRVPDDDSAVVTACETDDAYRFDVAGTKTSHEKAAFQDTLRGLIKGWLTESGVTPPADATVEYWLSVPEANPAAVQARAVVLSSEGNFAVYLTLDPAGWRVGDADVGLLGKATYPASFGHRAGRVLVQGAPGAEESAVAGFMALHDADAPDAFSAGWWSFRTPAFHEEEVAADALADPLAPAHVRSVALDDVVEWVATRVRAFRFPL